MPPRVAFHRTPAQFHADILIGQMGGSSNASYTFSTDDEDHPRAGLRAAGPLHLRHRHLPDQRCEGQLSKTTHTELQQILLTFASLSDTERQLFISQMNKYLLASSSQRKQFVEQWRRLLDASSRQNDALCD
ncbi:hypothetical protein [Burkholderia diffusa]|uniref:hypothetical protein n=1 Tax=Burkholderia diffusa TaxID=488732 RepID=UPI0012D8ED57|nr:hypothetical protein [Burkholderia diffusa]